MAGLATKVNPRGLREGGAVSRDEQVAELLAEPDGWWSMYTDVNHPDISHGAKAFYKASFVAQVWANPGSRYHRSQEVLKEIERGLIHLQRFAYPGCPQPNNWWAWKIGTPMALLDTLILTEGALDASLRQQIIDTVAYLLKAGDDLALSGPAVLPLADTPGQSDMNALWHKRLCLQLALVAENPAMAGKWAQRVNSEIGRPGEGSWQQDYSYKFHGACPMWAYGGAFLGDYGRIVEVCRGTFLAPGAQQLDRFADMALHYVNGFLYRGSMCPAMIGREITRGDDIYRSNFGLVAVRALAALVRAGHPRSPEMILTIAREREYFRDDPMIAAALAKLTEDLPSADPAPPVDDIFAYPDSDFLQVSRPGWAVGIKMHSKRNCGYESINGENLQGWFLSHGSMFHFIEGNEWKGCWPTIDWTRLPGTTVAVNVKSQNESPFVGVLRVSPRNAVAAMQMQSGGFKARKSWIVDGQAIVCLGSGISGPEPVETTLFNQPVAADTPIIVDGKALDRDAFDRDVTPEWIWLNGMGYVLPPGQVVRLARTLRSSDWTSVREARRHGAGEKSSIWYSTGAIRHSENVPVYRYIMLPDVKAEQMPALARDVLSRYQLENADIHRVAFGDKEACVFWNGGQAGELSADRGCIVWRDGPKWAAVDPAWEAKPLSLRIGGRVFTVNSERGRPAMPVPQ